MKVNINILQKNAVTLLFLLVLHAFIQLEHNLIAKALVLIFFVFLFGSYLSGNQSIKKYSATFSVALLVFIGLYFPLDIEEIEEL